MVDAARDLLNELMGQTRNLLPGEQKLRKKIFDDESICKYYLCGMCPNEMFINTRSDLGPCTKMHDDGFVEEYKKSSRYKRINYEEETFRYLHSIVAKCDGRIRQGQERLALTNSQAALMDNGGKKEERSSVLEERIKQVLQEVENLGSSGKVDEAQGMMKLCEELKDEKKKLEQSLEFYRNHEKQMEVCRICSCFLIVNDAPSRVDDHLFGKQHIGFVKLRKFIDELKEELYGPPRTAKTLRRSRSPQQPSAEKGVVRAEKNNDCPRTPPTDRRKQRRSRSREHRSRSRERRDRKPRNRSRSHDRRNSRDRNNTRDRRRSRDRHRRRSRSK